jgi:hypothetical protein
MIEKQGDPVIDHPDIHPLMIPYRYLDRFYSDIHYCFFTGVNRTAPVLELATM